jgi:hypothetical protein
MMEVVKYLPGLVLAVYLCIGTVAFSDEDTRHCGKLDQQVTGPAMKYSMTADVNGFVAYDDIGCSIEWRNRELCAMELSSFDITAKVFDFLTDNELEMAKAYYVVNASAPASSKVIAFSGKQGAEKYAAELDNMKVVDYTGLTELEFE